MSSFYDFSQFHCTDLSFRQHMGDSGDQIVEREHRPGFA